MGILLFADRLLQGERIESDLLNLADTGSRPLTSELFGDFCGRRITVLLLDKFTLGTGDLVDGFDHMDRNTDCAGLIG